MFKNVSYYHYTVGCEYETSDGISNIALYLIWAEVERLL